MLSSQGRRAVNYSVFGLAWAPAYLFILPHLYGTTMLGKPLMVLGTGLLAGAAYCLFDFLLAQIVYRFRLSPPSMPLVCAVLSFAFLVAAAILAGSAYLSQTFSFANLASLFLATAVLEASSAVSLYLFQKFST